MSTAEIRQEITKLKRRRGVVRSSITRLEKRVKELEEIVDQPTTTDHAQDLADKLYNLITDFKEYHFLLVDLIEDEDALEKEQDVLDEHDDLVSDINIQLKRLSSSDVPNPDETKLSIVGRRLNHLERAITTMHKTVSDLPTSGGDVSLVEQYIAQLNDQKAELSNVHMTLLSIDETSVRDKLSLHSRLEELIFDCFTLTRRQLKAYKESATSSEVDSRTESLAPGVRLPKLSAPTFDGNLLNWRQFWDQFCVSVHDRLNLSNPEKLVYLQYALKDG